MNSEHKNTHLRGLALLFLVCSAMPLLAKDKDAAQYGMGLSINVPYPSAQVEHAVQEVVQNGIIRGTKEYDKDEYLGGATAENSSKAFPGWTEGGKIYYKVRLKTVDPRNFRNAGDVGTVAVRYIVQPQGDKNAIVRIDALFVDDVRHAVHLSNGSVEGAEYKNIHDRLEASEVLKKQTLEAEAEKDAREAQGSQRTLKDESQSAAEETSSESASTGDAATVAANAEPKTSPQSLEEHVRELRHQVQRLVKAPGAPLKSAPFHTASTIQSLPSGTEVLIVIATPYWFGVETHDGRHGWMLRDELEMLP